MILGDVYDRILGLIVLGIVALIFYLDRKGKGNG